MNFRWIRKDLAKSYLIVAVFGFFELKFRVFSTHHFERCVLDLSSPSIFLSQSFFKFIVFRTKLTKKQS